MSHVGRCSDMLAATAWCLVLVLLLRLPLPMYCCRCRCSAGCMPYECLHPNGASRTQLCKFLRFLFRASAVAKQRRRRLVSGGRRPCRFELRSTKKRSTKKRPDKKLRRGGVAHRSQSQLKPHRRIVSACRATQSPPVLRRQTQKVSQAAAGHSSCVCACVCVRVCADDQLRRFLSGCSGG